MMKETFLDQLARNPHLPTLPGVALQILEKVNRPQCTIGEIGQIIGHDPALCSQVLKLVNSALFGLPRAITSIDRALNLLGLKRVRSLVLSLSLPTMQARSKANPRMRDFWKVATAEAIVTRELAIRLRYPDPETEMVSGLLSDLGILLLQETYSEQYLQVLAFPPEVLVNDQCELEEKIFGCNHAEIAAYILHRWRLPEEMTEPIRWHHQPDKAGHGHGPRAHLLYFANRVAQLQLNLNHSPLLGEIMGLALRRYGMNDKQFKEFLEPLTGKIEELASLLQVDIGTCQEYPTLIANATENLTRLAMETSLDNIRAEEEKTRAKNNLKKAEEALQQTEEKLRQALKMEAIGRLAGGVAHDFNNLLTIINGYGEVVLAQMPADDPKRGFIEEIKKAGDRAAELTRQLLAFSRKQILIPEVINLNNIVVAMDKMLRRLIGEDIQLVTVPDQSLGMVKVDPSQMDQVIMNLAVNARDAMPQGGKLTIETANVFLDGNYVKPYDDLKPGPYVLLGISDTGCGMSDEVKTKIFEPFFTTKESGKGTGLGLATVHGIVKQSGGHVAVYSEQGHGTTFKIYFPAVTEPLVRPEPVKNGTVSVDGSETILLTEDEDGVRRIARLTLESFGYTVLEARDGVEALKLSQGHQGPIHLLVTDTIMPHMGGCELADRLAETRPDLKVIYMSGYTDEAIVRHGVLNPGIPFLQKPFTPQALGNKIREVLQKSPGHS